MVSIVRDYIEVRDTNMAADYGREYCINLARFASTISNAAMKPPPSPPPPPPQMIPYVHHIKTV